MSGRIKATPSGESFWSITETEHGRLYMPEDRDVDPVVINLASANPEKQGLRIVGKGDREDGNAATCYKSGRLALRAITSGVESQSDFSWVQANLMLQEALLATSKHPSCLKDGVRTPDYLAALATDEEFRVVMSFEGARRRHPFEVADRPAETIRRAVSSFVDECIDGYWGRAHPIYLDTKASNVLIGKHDAVVLDAYPVDSLDGSGEYIWQKK